MLPIPDLKMIDYEDKIPSMVAGQLVPYEIRHWKKIPSIDPDKIVKKYSKV